MARTVRGVLIYDSGKMLHVSVRYPPPRYVDVPEQQPIRLGHLVVHGGLAFGRRRFNRRQRLSDESSAYYNEA